MLPYLHPLTKMPNDFCDYFTQSKILRRSHRSSYNNQEEMSLAFLCNDLNEYYEHSSSFCNDEVHVIAGAAVDTYQEH